MKVAISIQIVILMMSVSIDCLSQDRQSKKGSSVLMIGHDLGRPIFGQAFASPDTRASTKYNYFIPSLGYEYGFAKKWSVGSKLGYSNVYKERNGSSISFNSYTLREKKVAVSVFANYYLIRSKKAEWYAGAGAGYKRTTFTATGDYIADPNNAEFSLLFKTGYRYYFSKHFGAFVEGEYQPFPSVVLAGVVYSF
jgi:Protein of unknown function, DUF481